jgi:hypothetical protein
MKAHSSQKSILMLVMTLSLFSPAASAKQDGKDEGYQESEAQDSEDSHLSPATPAFKARIEIDNKQPVSYGDDVHISVWITPHKNLDVDHVRLHPKGNLLTLYHSTEEVRQELSGAQRVTVEQGIPCRTRELNHRAGVPFVVSCGMDSLQNGWKQWFDQNSLLDSGRQRFEIEIALEEGPGAVTRYYEVGSIEFVSPKAAVVLGGFFGALVLSLLTFVSKPIGDPPKLGSWKEIAVRLRKTSPQRFASLGFGALDVLRKALLGGVTAMVLIILAKSSEGFEAPVSLRIQDFWGGLLVGLISGQLANWVMNKIASLIQPANEVR